MPAQPFLFDLFNAARVELHLPLGLGEYFTLVEALRKGHGVIGQEDLRLLCETLWIKNERQRHAFREFFHRHMDDELQTALQALDSLNKKPEEEAVRESDQEKKEEKRQPEREQKRDSPVPESSTSTEQPAAEDRDAEILLSMEEGEGEVSLSEEEIHELPSILSHRFVFTDSYLPLTERQLRQNWRLLRSHTESGWSDELDLLGTIARVAREGFFNEPAFLPDRRNKLRLLMLVDHQGSMVAFRRLTEELVETALHGGGQQTRVLFFRNFPGDKLFLKPDRTQAISRRKMLAGLSKKYSNVVIISDAGAARGRLDTDRLDETWDFLDLLKSQARHVAWMNPMPRDRWAGTTAAHIADLVPMFEVTPEGVRMAIKVLRGKNQ